jgi:hypothetical protein
MADSARLVELSAATEAAGAAAASVTADSAMMGRKFLVMSP